MFSRHICRVVGVIASVASASIGSIDSAYSQTVPPTTTPVTQVTATTTIPSATEGAKVVDASSVTVSIGPGSDIETSRSRFIQGSAISETLLSTGLFASASLLSTTDSVITAATAGCETKSNRQFYFVQPALRFYAVDPFLIEAQVVNVKPLDSRCVTNSLTVTMKGPFKSYSRVKTPGSGRADAKIRNFFELVYALDATTSKLTFKIADESYLKFFRKLQNSGLLSRESALSNSVVLAAVTPKLTSALSSISSGGSK